MQRFAATACALAAVAMTCQPANAFLLERHKKVSPPVRATAVGAGIASTVTYWSLLDWSWDKKSRGYKLGAAGAVTFGCMVLSPMVAAALKKRELTLREVYVLEGSCIVPIIGGLLVNAAFDANPQWDEPAPVKVTHRTTARRSTSSAR
jgi:hypothetical protein